MKQFSQILCSILLGLLLFIVPAGAADKPVKFGYVISDKILVESKAGKAFIERKKAFEEQKKEEINIVIDQLKALKTELTRKGMFLNDEARTQLSEDIQSKERQVKRLEEDIYADLRKFVKKEMKAMNDDASKIVMKLGKDEGFTMIIDINSRASNIVYVDDALDLTDRILEVYDRKFLEGRVLSGK